MAGRMRTDWVEATRQLRALTPAMAGQLAETLGALQHRGRQPLQALRLALDGMAGGAGDLGVMAQACVDEMVAAQDRLALAVRLLRRAGNADPQPAPGLLGLEGAALVDVELVRLAVAVFDVAEPSWRAERGGLRVTLTGASPAEAPPLAGLCIAALKGAGFRPKVQRDGPVLSLSLWMPRDG
jgi:hypothetical protein